MSGPANTRPEFRVLQGGADAAGADGKQVPAPTRQRRSSKLRVIAPLQLPDDWEMRPGVPATRADCANVPRPCPYVECRHHLWLRLQQEQAGNPQRGRQGPTTFRPSTMQSCALDVAEHGASYEEIGQHLGVDSTRVRQIAQRAVAKLIAANPDIDELAELLNHV